MNTLPRPLPILTALTVAALALSGCGLMVDEAAPSSASSATTMPASSTSGSPSSSEGSSTAVAQSSGAPEGSGAASAASSYVSPAERASAAPATPPDGTETDGAAETDRGTGADGDSASVAPEAGAPSSSAASSTNPWAVPGGGVTDCSVESCVALTFDDGPHHPGTDQVLDALAARGVPATFFVLGENAVQAPELLVRMDAEGHEIGSHTYSHRDLTGLGWSELVAEIDGAQDAVKDATGEAPTLLRPPFAFWNGTVEQTASVRGLSRVLWNLDTMDWQHRDPARTAAAVEGARPGDVILMHDIYTTSAAAVGDVVDRLEAKGYTLVTVSDLRDG